MEYTLQFISVVQGVIVELVCCDAQRLRCADAQRTPARILEHLVSETANEIANNHGLQVFAGGKEASPRRAIR